MWNWQNSNWPNFTWDAEKLVKAELLFAKGTGLLIGTRQSLNEADNDELIIELMIEEAMETSAIEGEYLDRASVQSSIRRHLGLQNNHNNNAPAEAGIAEMMVNLYKTLNDPLDHKTLFSMHQMVMNGRRDLSDIGKYRTHSDPMEIVSGPDYARKVHYEAPPSIRVESEMERFIIWFNETSKGQKKYLPSITRAGIAHLWFESIHPFEDGNGRIGRALSEKALGVGSITSLSATIIKRRKEYYQALEDASSSMEITNWLLWFALVNLDSQKNSQAQVLFLINKAKLFDRVKNDINLRQTKVLLRLFKEGPKGFLGGLSSQNYARITGASPATISRDLSDMVQKGILKRTGENKGTRYQLNVPLTPVINVSIDEIS